MTALLLLVVVEIVDVSVANNAVMVEARRTRAVFFLGTRRPDTDPLYCSLLFLQHSLLCLESVSVCHVTTRAQVMRRQTIWRILIDGPNHCKELRC